MRDRIFGLVGVVWGGLLCLRLFTKGITPTGDAAFDLGRGIGALMGALMLIAGVYYLAIGDGTPKRKAKRKKRSIRTPTDAPQL
jgi:hypothetical protein